MILMKIFFLIMLFFMGTVFGSFFTLAVYRIPLNLDITHERSFCPNCNHRLEFIDLIPVFSYLSLGGKCRYCGNPVRIRYLVLEVLSGLVFLLAYFAFNLNFPFFEQHSIAIMISFVMFYVTNAIILGIDKEYKKIDKRVLLFGIITQTIYIIYLYAFENVQLYKYTIFLIILLGLFCLDTYFLKKLKKDSYLIQLAMLIVYELYFIKNWKISIGMFLGSIIIFLIYKLFNKKNIPVGFCITLSSIISVLVGNFIIYF